MCVCVCCVETRRNSPTPLFLLAVRGRIRSNHSCCSEPNKLIIHPSNLLLLVLLHPLAFAACLRFPASISLRNKARYCLDSLEALFT